MKRIIAIVLVLAFLAGVSGCASNSFLCKNKDSILNGLQLVISQATATIAAVQAAYPGIMPPMALAVLQAAQTAKDLASAAAAKACPTDTDLTTAQGQMVYANQLKIMATMNKMMLEK